MTDMNTERRQAEIGKWADKTLGEILSETPQPSSVAARMWYVVETLMAWAGMWLISVVALWLCAAILGLYFDIIVGGFGAGRYAMAFLLGWWPL